MLLLGQSLQASSFFANVQSAPTITSGFPVSTLSAGNSAWARGPAGKYLGINYISSTTPTACLIDDSAATATALTYSGSFSGGVASNGSSNFMTYSSTQDKYYILSNFDKKIYVVSLSGTVLTVGTEINISATFTGAVGTTALIGDGTDLFVLDKTGLFKKYTLPSGGFGATLSAPNLTGFDITDTTYWRLYYTNGYIWLIGVASASASAKVSKIQKYDIAGNSWSTVTVPDVLSGLPASEVGFNVIGFYMDRSVNTEFYIQTLKYLFKYTVATGAVEKILIGGTDANNLPVTANTWTAKNAKDYRADMICDYSRCFAHNTTNSGAEGFNMLAFLGTSNYTRITGPGALLGFVAINWQAYNSSGQPNLNGNIIVKYSIDGGTPKYINLNSTRSQDTINKYIPFTTSLDYAFYQPLGVTSAANATSASVLYKTN